MGFNREVAEDAALYWSKAPGDLAKLIEQADAMPQAEIDALAAKARQRIATAYSWEFICSEYENLFLK